MFQKRGPFTRKVVRLKKDCCRHWVTIYGHSYAKVMWCTESFFCAHIQTVQLCNPVLDVHVYICKHCTEHITCACDMTCLISICTSIIWHIVVHVYHEKIKMCVLYVSPRVLRFGNYQETCFFSLLGRSH